MISSSLVKRLVGEIRELGPDGVVQVFTSVLNKLPNNRQWILQQFRRGLVREAMLKYSATEYGWVEVNPDGKTGTLINHPETIDKQYGDLVDLVPLFPVEFSIGEPVCLQVKP